jgi:hypothetical protein
MSAIVGHTSILLAIRIITANRDAVAMPMKSAELRIGVDSRYRRSGASASPPRRRHPFQAPSPKWRPDTAIKARPPALYKSLKKESSD